MAVIILILPKSSTKSEESHGESWRSESVIRKLQMEYPQSYIGYICLSTYEHWDADPSRSSLAATKWDFTKRNIKTSCMAGGLWESLLCKPNQYNRYTPCCILGASPGFESHEFVAVNPGPIAIDPCRNKDPRVRSERQRARTLAINHPVVDNNPFWFLLRKKGAWNS